MTTFELRRIIKNSDYVIQIKETEDFKLKARQPLAVASF